MDLLPEIEEIGNVDVLSAVLEAIETVENPQQLRQVYQSLPDKLIVSEDEN